jgi:ribosomal protein S5
VLEVAGVRDILTKCIGTSNKINVVKATLDALRQLESGAQVATRRGKALEEIGLRPAGGDKRAPRTAPRPAESP